MEDAIKTLLLKNMTDETDTEVLTAYLTLAKNIILTKAYPFEDDTSNLKFPSKYDDLQVRMAAYLMNKRGAEGETMHTESSTTRQYESGDIPSSMLNEIVPFAGELK